MAAIFLTFGGWTAYARCGLVVDLMQLTVGPVPQATAAPSGKALPATDLAKPSGKPSETKGGTGESQSPMAMPLGAVIPLRPMVQTGVPHVLPMTTGQAILAAPVVNGDEAGASTPQVQAKPPGKPEGGVAKKQKSAAPGPSPTPAP
ncbi:MAG: hypothetical protein HY815_21905 [Candidatus Riflebacteria bacterium]|nr:hypothetical protein [Candidatus Riflebacteria bacterium]